MTIVPSSFRLQQSVGDLPAKSSSMLPRQGSGAGTVGTSVRLPLRPRNANVDNRIRGTAMTSSSSSSSSLLQKQPSLKSLGAVSCGGAVAATLSAASGKYSYNVDSSGNECNRRIVVGSDSGNSSSCAAASAPPGGTSMSSAVLASSTLRKFASGPSSATPVESDRCTDASSTVAETGQKIAANILKAKPARSASPAPSAVASSSSASTSECTGERGSTSRPRGGQGPANSSRKSFGAEQTPMEPQSTRSSSDPTISTSATPEEVVIEERRRSPSGDSYSVHKYVRGKLIGKGGFAKVYCCTSLDTGRNYAVKIVPKANLVKSRARQKLQAEIKIHRTLKHEHICEFKHFFEDKTNCYILLELCQNQSMNELIKRRKRLTETEVKYYMLHLIDAVKYMHERNVIHRDLKLGNLFLDKNLHVKVGDLGLATRVSSAEEKRKTICGTPNYIAPEVIDGNKETRGHSFEVDIWSMGVILYTTLVGKPPYESKDVKSTYQRILANKYSFPNHVPISQHARDLIMSMLQTKPEDRPSLEQISLHPFLTHVIGKLPKTLPQSCAHMAPDWQEDGNSNLFVAERGHDEEKISEITAERGSRHKKHREESKSSSVTRQPLSSKENRDPNGAPDREDEENEKQNKKVIEDGNMLSPSGKEARSGRETKRERRLSAARSKSSQRFRIYDENGGTEVVQETEVESIPKSAKSRHEKPPQCIVDDLDALASKVTACTLNERGAVKTAPEQPCEPDIPTEEQVQSTNSKRETTPVTTAGKDKDLMVLESMYARLTEIFDIADKKAAGVEDELLLFNRTSAAGSSTAFGIVTDWGATKWVTRYVDYTSKYGLGFLLNNGSAGVYFNDSTKAVLAPKGEKFMYIERRKICSDGRLENMCEIHTLSTYPETLQKKVTLLKHFRNYLVEQQKRAVEEGEEDKDIFDISLDLEAVEYVDCASLVYLKKWVRTKHAILFRLSNSTVQVVFYDHTEILLSSEARIITYVDKKHRRITYKLHEIMMDSNAEISKRLKYTKDILQQLIPGKH